MHSKFYRAFGYLILKHKFEVGEKFTDGFSKDSIFTVDRKIDFGVHESSYREDVYNHIWLYTKGVGVTTNLQTGEVYIRKAGWCSLNENHPFGEFQVDFTDQTVFFCLSPNVNLKNNPILPRISYFHMGAGEKRILDSGTKLFLADGSLIDAGNVITGTLQIKVNHPKMVEAVEDCYGYFFE